MISHRPVAMNRSGMVFYMKNKQLIALVVAAVLFIIIGASNVLVQVEAEKERVTSGLTEESYTYLEYLLGYADEEIDYEESFPSESFVAVISITGTIQAGYDASTGYAHQETLDYIDALMNNYSNKAILLYEETPGGTVIDSDELYLKLMEYKETTGRPVYAYFHSYAYSGGYYVAMAADEIIANRNATLGSIGVIVSTYNLSGLYEKLGIEEINITSGANKSMFTSDDEEQTAEQISIYQAIVDDAYDQFLGIVETGRNMTANELESYADGSIFSAQDALEYGLIDEVVNTYDDALTSVTESLGYEYITFSSMPVSSGGIWDLLFSKLESVVPKSDNQVLQELANTESKGLMYYAEP